jgi:CubicO group peptidase (beta-lactamase class C family)
MVFIYPASGVPKPIQYCHGDFGEDNAMTHKQPGRRDFLKAAATVLTVASFLVVGAAPASGAAVSGKLKEDIDQALRQAVDAREVPGVVAMAATDKGPVYEGAFGTRDLAKGPDMTLDTVFWIASMTKAVTALAAMQLVEQGKLQLDQAMGTLLPELASPQVNALLLDP